MNRQGIVIVLDSVGVGYAADAAFYGDAGANTLGHILEKTGVHFPNLIRLGLNTAMDLAAGKTADNAPDEFAVGVMSPAAAGKDTTTGHWEIAGAPLEIPFAVFPHFPSALVKAIEDEAGVTFIGNIAASGTKVIEQLGAQSVESGCPILYTSADSVFQIAAHETAFGLERLFATCEIARRHCDAWSIGRVIARPFTGEVGAFTRTANRHDYAMQPPRTILNALLEAGVPVTGVGKISDIFASSGITRSIPTSSNAEGMAVTADLIAKGEPGLIFVNLVDFDMLFGHRRDVEGYAHALEEFDAWLGKILPMIDGVSRFLVITADHGNDPTWQGTDHTRERVPIFVKADKMQGSLGVQTSFAYVADLLATAWNLTEFKPTFK